MRERIVLRLLADPENAERHEAHHKWYEPRRQDDQCLPEFAFRMNLPRVRRTDVEHQHRHGEGENAVAKRG